jgi:hypothetical protein
MAILSQNPVLICPGGLPFVHTAIYAGIPAANRAVTITNSFPKAQQR